jgi:hypothetical protein
LWTQSLNDMTSNFIKYVLPWFSGFSLVVLGGWIGSFLSVRKDERAIQIEQITEERTRWREKIRQLCDNIVKDLSGQRNQSEGQINRSKLVTSLNPKDPDDNEILVHYDALYSGDGTNLALFTKRIALLLKHDWERVKYECTPFYCKPFTNRAWRHKGFRKVD